jgi:hypothetical protein
MFERGHAALQAIKAVPKVAHFGGQRQNTRTEELQTDFFLTHPSPPSASARSPARGAAQCVATPFYTASTGADTADIGERWRELVVMCEHQADEKCVVFADTHAPSSIGTS